MALQSSHSFLINPHLIPTGVGDRNSFYTGGDWKAYFLISFFVLSALDLWQFDQESQDLKA